jgi:hypothetical protein
LSTDYHEKVSQSDGSGNRKPLGNREQFERQTEQANKDFAKTTRGATRG